MESLALRGKNLIFYRVIKMVHDVVLLVSEQTDDDDETEMRRMQIDKIEDDIEVLDVTIFDSGQSRHCSNC